MAPPPNERNVNGLGPKNRIAVGIWQINIVKLITNRPRQCDEVTVDDTDEGNLPKKHLPIIHAERCDRMEK